MLTPGTRPIIGLWKKKLNHKHKVETKVLNKGMPSKFKYPMLTSDKPEA